MSEDERGLPPATLQRLRQAVLRCIAAVAGSSSAAPVLATVTADVAQAVAPLLGDSFVAAEREAAAKVLRYAPDPIGGHRVQCFACCM